MQFIGKVNMRKAVKHKSMISINATMPETVQSWLTWFNNIYERLISARYITIYSCTVSINRVGGKLSSSLNNAMSGLL